mgnify:CR=1 FL=1
MAALAGSFVAACGAADATVCDPGPIHCDACVGTWQCAYGDTEVIADGCDGCQTRAELYDELCEQGSTATLQEVQDGVECERLDADGG